MIPTEPSSFMESPLSKTKMRRAIHCRKSPQPCLLSRIDLNNTSSPSLHSQIDSPALEPVQQLSLLSWIEMNSIPLLDRMQLPKAVRAPPLLMMISTSLLKIVGGEDIQNCQQPKRCLSLWNGSPVSRPHYQNCPRLTRHIRYHVAHRSHICKGKDI